MRSPGMRPGGIILDPAYKQIENLTERRILHFKLCFQSSNAPLVEDRRRPGRRWGTALVHAFRPGIFSYGVDRIVTDYSKILKRGVKHHACH